MPTKHKKVLYREIVNGFLIKFGISPTWSQKGVQEKDGIFKSYFWAVPDDREVCIPRPTNKIKLMDCLHEIGHVVRKLRRHTYWQEYLAEDWAITAAKRFGITSHVYEKRAAELLAIYIKSDVKTHLVHPDDVKPEVLKFIRKRRIRLTKKELFKIYYSS